MSENVGSKDLLPETHVFKNQNDLVVKVIENDIENTKLKTIDEHSKEVIQYYERVINDS